MQLGSFLNKAGVSVTLWASGFLPWFINSLMTESLGWFINKHSFVFQMFNSLVGLIYNTDFFKNNLGDSFQFGNLGLVTTF